MNDNIYKHGEDAQLLIAVWQFTPVKPVGHWPLNVQFLIKIVLSIYQAWILSLTYVLKWRYFKASTAIVTWVTFARVVLKLTVDSVVSRRTSTSSSTLCINEINKNSKNRIEFHLQIHIWIRSWANTIDAWVAETFVDIIVTRKSVITWSTVALPKIWGWLNTSAIFAWIWKTNIY